MAGYRTITFIAQRSSSQRARLPLPATTVPVRCSMLPGGLQHSTGAARRSAAYGQACASQDEDPRLSAACCICCMCAASGEASMCSQLAPYMLLIDSACLTSGHIASAEGVTTLEGLYK